MGRRQLAAVLLAGFLCLPAQAAPYQGRIAQVIGTASVNGRPARVGMTVAAGDKIRTEAKGRVDMIWANGSALRLMPASQMVVKRWDSEQHITLSFGGLLSVLAKGVRYHTASPNAVAAVTGTVYYHEESAKLPGYVCVCKGSVGIRHPEADQHKPVASSKHTAVSVLKADVNEVGMIDGNHTDKDIAELQALQRQR